MSFFFFFQDNQQLLKMFRESILPLWSKSEMEDNSNVTMVWDVGHSEL